MSTRRRGVKTKYSPLSSTDHYASDEHDGEEFSDEQFRKPKPKVPWLSVIFITILFLGGVVRHIYSFILLKS